MGFMHGLLQQQGLTGKLDRILNSNFKPTGSKWFDALRLGSIAKGKVDPLQRLSSQQTTNAAPAATPESGDSEALGKKRLRRSGGRTILTGDLEPATSRRSLLG